MRLALLLLAAGCGPKGPVASAPPSSDHEAECPSVPPTGYRVYRGEASGRDGGAAVAAAREVARRHLLDAACAGVSETRCAAIAREVKPWKAGYFDAKGGYACASVAVEAATLESFQADQALFDAGIRHLGAEIADLADGGPVWIADPRWASGCSAGPLGSSLAGLLTNEVAKHGVALSAPSGSTGVLQVQQELAPGTSRVVLTAFAFRGADPASTALRGFDFPVDLFGTPEAVGVGTCRTNEALGLGGGARTGARGLTVGVEVRTDHGVVCEGATVEPAIVVNRPADVQVYSVARDGRALLVWPPPGGSPRVEGRLSLGALRAVAQPDAGDERLVAVAVEAGARFGRSHGWTGFCKVDGAFRSDLYPEGSAVGTSTFTVIPADRPVPGTTCPVVPDLAALRSTLFEPASCP